MGRYLDKELARLWADLDSTRRRLEGLSVRLEQITAEVRAAEAATPPSPTEGAPTVESPAPAEAPPPPAETPAVPSETAPVKAPPPIEVAPPVFERPRPTLSLEQRLGASWLNKAGVVVLILGAVFFFQYAAQQGWIGKPVRVLCGVAAGAVLLGLGEWTLRKGWRLFAGGVTGGGIAMLYLSVYAGSPKLYGLISTPWAFGLMCAVSALAIGASLRSGMIATGVLAQVGAYLTPLLLSTGRDEQVVLMIYLMVVAAAFLTVAAARRWDVLALISLGGTVALFIGWCAAHYAQPAQCGRTAAFGWALLGLFVAWAALATARGRAHEFTGIAVAAGAGAALAVLLAGLCNHMGAWAYAGHLLALEAAVLAVCLWRRWAWLRAGVLAWTAVLLWVGIAFHTDPGWGWREAWSVRIWLAGGLLLIDMLVRARRRSRRTREALDAALATLAVGGAFAATYGLLNVDHHAWMGLYAAALAAGALLGALAIHRLWRRRILAYAFLGQGLVLLTLAMPIQFDRSTLTIAWASQGVVAMALAWRLGSRLLRFKSVFVLILAVVHFRLVDVPLDARLAAEAFALAGVSVPWTLLLAGGLLLAAWASAVMVRAGRGVLSEADERTLTVLLLGLGAVVWGWQTSVHLPPAGATWCWLAAAAAVVWVVGRRPEGRWLIGVGAAMLAAVVLRLLGYDMLIAVLEGGQDMSSAVALNWQFAAALATTGACLAAGRLWRMRLGDWPNTETACDAAVLCAALIVVWAGSFEVDRFFAAPRGLALADVAHARQMGLSIWWALFAAALLAVGFAARRSVLRYMALGLFAVTLGKVLLVDMARVDLVYRIASFLALGALLVAASMLYQRFFRDALAWWDRRSD